MAFVKRTGSAYLTKRYLTHQSVWMHFTDVARIRAKIVRVPRTRGRFYQAHLYRHAVSEGKQIKWAVAVELAELVFRVSQNRQATNMFPVV